VADAAGVARVSSGGKTLWRADAVAQNPENFALSPSALNGTTFVPGRDALVAVDDAGAELWRAASPGSAFTGSASF